MSTKIVLQGRFLGFDADRYVDKQTGEQRKTMVLVFESDNIRYPEIVKVGKDYADEVERKLKDLADTEVALNVFAGRNGGLWFRGFADAT